MEPIMHKYIEQFIQKMEEIGHTEQGVDLHTVSALSHQCNHIYKRTNVNISFNTQWADRLAMDMSSEIAYGRKMGQIENSKFVTTIMCCATFAQHHNQARTHPCWILSGK